MNRLLKFAAVGVGVLMLTAPAWADGFYAAGRGGWNHVQGDNLNDSGQGDAEYSNGYIVGGAFGYAWTNGFRAEAEVMYRDNDVDKVGFPGARQGATGDVTSWSGMGNLYYDLKFPGFPLVPYVGAGVGAVRVRMDNVRVNGALLSNDNDTSAAVQGIVGIAYPFTPRAQVTLDYRYMYAPNLEFSGPANFDTSYQNQSVTAGIRVNF